VQVLLEPLGPQSRLPELLAGVAAQKLLRRRLDLATGLVTLAEAAPGEGLQFDGSQLLTVHGPRLRLLLIGGGQLSRCLAQMAQMLDYQITVCEPRTEYHEDWNRLPGVTLSTTMPDDLVLAMQLDASCAVVALTHDPKLDDLALMEALRTPAFYVGAIGSLKNNAARRERLRGFGLSDEELARLRGPVGLNLRALTPPEIALSVVAELTALRRGADLAAPLLDWSRSSTACRSA
jgi:xanthine dehydrogenase accessory factor